MKRVREDYLMYRLDDASAAERRANKFDLRVVGPCFAKIKGIIFLLLHQFFVVIKNLTLKLEHNVYTAQQCHSLHFSNTSQLVAQTDALTNS